jgi:hypothetical protein
MHYVGHYTISFQNARSLQHKISSVRLDQCFSNFLSQVDCHNTQLVHVPVGTANMNAYFQDAGLPGCCAGWQV